MNEIPAAKSAPRILWRALTGDAVQIDRLHEASATGGVVVTETAAPVGEHLRIELLGEAGERIAAGLARVVAVDGERMRIDLVALGIDPRIVAMLVRTGDASAPASPRVPPPLPNARAKAPAVPPPLPAVPPPVAERDDAYEPQIEPLAMKRTGTIIGIDLGTTNTCASYVVDGRPRVIPGRMGSNVIPSMITFDPSGTFHVGQRAADRQVLQPLRTVYGSKRLLGRTYRAELATDMQRHFAFPLAEAEGQRFGVRIDDRVVSMDTLAARILDEVRASAEAHLGTPVEAAVITVPAYFSEVQREAVRRAAREANLVVHRIVNEPTAAAVAYGQKERSRARVAVWDFGGGTFDFSIVDVAGGRFDVVATGGDCFLGGSDFDDLVASYLLGEFRRSAGVAIDPDPQQIARLREAAEGAKRTLSSQSDVLVELPEFVRAPRRDLVVELTRQRFEELAAPLVQRTVAIATEVMETANVAPSQIDDVVLVGGTTRVPAVQEAVAGLFGRRPSKRINPDEAVALGAALLADEIRTSDGPTLVDILPMSVGRGTTGLRFEPIVPRYARLPAERELVVDADLLGSVHVPLFQGDAADVSRNEYLCSVVVEDRSLWEKGRVLLRLSFDEHCVMAVEAKNARTGAPLPVTLDRSRALDDVLRELGKWEGERAPTWQLPESTLGRVLGKLSRLFGR